MKTKHHKSTRCPICQATVIVYKYGKLSARLLRSLALANHVKAVHEKAINYE